MVLFKHIRKCINEVNTHHISTYAAGASFFLITSLLPLLMLVLSIFSWTGLELDAEFTACFSRLIPEALQDVLDFVIRSLNDVGAAEFSISAIALFWAASKGMIGIVDGLNNIAGNEDKRNFILKRLICLLYMVVLMAVLLVTLGLRVFGSEILSFLQKYLPYAGKVFSEVLGLKGITLYLIIVLVIALIYSLFPNKKMPFIKQLPGAAIASAAWLIFSAIYSIYIDYASTSSAIYGGLGIIIFAMLWVYFCVYIIFIGAVINRLYPDVTSTIIGKIKRKFTKPHCKKTATENQTSSEQEENL